MLNVGVKIDGAVGATGQVDDDDFNAGTQELKNAVTRSGQTLSGANSEQVAEAMGINAGAASSCVDSGTANSVVLTPTTGAAGIKLPTTYTLFNGWEVFFYIKETNTGNVTINIGQTVGIGIKKLLQKTGDEISPGALPLGSQVRARYDPLADSSTGAWVIDASIITKVPTGTILINPTDTLPGGYLPVEGASVSRTTYADLFVFIGIAYGNVDANTFNLPDYRGLFLRGFDNGAGNDPDVITRTDRGDSTTGDNVGTKQLDAGQTITGFVGTTYTILDGSTGAFSEGSFVSGVRAANAANNAKGAEFDSSTSTSPNTAKTSDFETRPTNINVRYIIKT